jgi:hypothetical protein
MTTNWVIKSNTMLIKAHVTFLKPKYIKLHDTLRIKLMVKKVSKMVFSVVFDLSTSTIKHSARAIAISIYNMVHTIGNTIRGGVIPGLMHSYHGVRVSFVTSDGTIAINRTMINDVI